MRKILNGLKLACAIGVVLGSGQAASAGDVPTGKMALRAVKKNGSDIAPTSEVSAVVGDELTCEIRIFDFEDLSPLGGARAFQATVQGVLGAQSGGNPLGYILPKGWNAPFNPVPCTTNADCDAVGPGMTCATTSTFTCVGVGHNPSQGYILNKSDPEWLHFGFTTTDGIRATGLDVSYFSTTDSIGPTDPGGNFEYYGGTLVLTVRPFACGTYTFALRADEAILTDPFFNRAQLALTPLKINLPACPPIKIASDPTDCSIDARRPHSPSNVSPKEGYSSALLTFNQPTTGMTTSNFTIRTVPTLAGLGFSVTTLPATNQVRINFLRQGNPAVIDTNRYTCVKHVQTDLENCFGNLPADVDQSRKSEAVDLTALVAAFNAPSMQLPLGQCDIDRSGKCSPQDILAEADLLNGAESFTAWKNQIINLTNCPSE